MTNEEAVEILTGRKQYGSSEPEKEAMEYRQALDLAIKALETGEVYMTGVDYNLYIEGYKDGKRDFEPKQGEWIEVDRSEITHNMAGEVLTYYRCSNCDRTLSIYPSMLTDYPFCHCGADMRKGDTK